jgi:hypothetical protein
MHVKDPVYDKIQEFETTLKEKKVVAQDVRDKRIKGEAKVEQLKKNEKDFLDKIKTAGLDPNELKAYIIDRQKKLSAVLKKLDDVLPDENGMVQYARSKENINALDTIDVVSGDVKIPEDLELPEAKADELPPIVENENPAGFSSEAMENSDNSENGDDLFAELGKSTGDSQMPF